MALQAVKTVTKVSLVGGAVYWSVAQGIWGTCEEGAEIGKRLANSVQLTSSEQKPPEKTETKASGLCDEIVKNWNVGVSFIFTSLLNVPEGYKAGTSKLQTYFKDITSGQKSAE